MRSDYEAWVAGGMHTVTTDPAPAPAPDPGPGPEWELVTTRTFTEDDGGMLWEISIKGWKRRQ